MSGDSSKYPKLPPAVSFLTDQPPRLFLPHKLEIRVQFESLDRVKELLVHHRFPQIRVQVSQSLEQDPQFNQILLDLIFNILERDPLFEAFRRCRKLTGRQILVQSFLAGVAFAIRFVARGQFGVFVALVLRADFERELRIKKARFPFEVDVALNFVWNGGLIWKLTSGHDRLQFWSSAQEDAEKGEMAGK